MVCSLPGILISLAVNELDNAFLFQHNDESAVYNFFVVAICVLRWFVLVVFGASSKKTHVNQIFGLVGTREAAFN